MRIHHAIKGPLAAMVLAQALVASAPAEPVLDANALLQRQDFWVNRDFAWFAENIPLLDSPDKELDTTYYYRWELVTRHLVYAHPNTGYVFTEFANRPSWSGAYGTISCPAGMQLDDIRWLSNPRYARDYMRFWMRHPGAQPRRYSFWAAESAWSIHEVNPHAALITGLLPDLVDNYTGWERRCWVEDMGMFWQLGHDDGMEFDINARQTTDILRGGPSLRPSFNAYMWADAKAIERVAELQGDRRLAARYAEKAERIKSRVQDTLWDPSRSFFFPMSNQRHEKDGHVVERHTLTYETGRFAGSLHGRELHGYVPWVFNLPDPGFEAAWLFLMDEDFFKAPFGPTTVERNDPMFVLQDGCCWWSGQSWPFATAQTLKAMANLLQNYRQDHVDRQDYADLLHTFATSHRKDGRPYIAEALNPFTGSWRGHDMENRSEHYFHSGFTDLVITGLAGLQPATGDTVTIKPLVPPGWAYFALDGIHYHGHVLSVLWDADGSRYGRGEGLQLVIDGETAARSAEVGVLQARLPGGTRTIPLEMDPAMNFAVNNDGDYYPRHSASYVGPQGSLAMLSDGQYVYDPRPVNRWTAVGSPNDNDWVEVDFGTARTLDAVKVYVIDDGEGSSVRAPAAIHLNRWDGKGWEAVPGARSPSGEPEGGRPYVISFHPLETSRIQVLLDHAAESRSGLTEIEAWGPGVAPYRAPRPPEGNLAYNPRPETGFPKASASFSDRYGGVPQLAIDGRTIFQSNPVNRWTSFGSPNAESDWLEVDFGEPETVGRVILHVFDDGGGVRAPGSIHLEYWDGNAWRGVEQVKCVPEKPTGGMANTLTFPRIETSSLRAVFRHVGQGEVRSGVTEIEVWRQ